MKIPKEDVNGRPKELIDTMKQIEWFVMSLKNPELMDGGPSARDGSRFYIRLLNDTPYEQQKQIGFYLEKLAEEVIKAAIRDVQGNALSPAEAIEILCGIPENFVIRNPNNIDELAFYLALSEHLLKDGIDPHEDPKGIIKARNTMPNGISNKLSADELADVKGIIRSVHADDTGAVWHAATQNILEIRRRHVEDTKVLDRLRKSDSK